tara:strand:- start:940 stop:1962 length:1023 start_codon:yes stop_codon:yes gene_type:complete
MKNIEIIFDGHNDLLLRLWMAKDHNGKSFIQSSRVKDKDGHLDVESAKKGGFAGGFFAIFSPSPGNWLSTDRVDTSKAKNVADEMLSIATTMATENPSIFSIVLNYDDILSAIENKRIACILHFEGAEMIEGDLSNLEHFFELGVRSIGPVWSRPNAFGHGVPFGFPGSPNQGQGLTDAGKNLIRECNELGILIDLSHLNEAGFWDVSKISTKPLVATHSNAYELCESPRNLTKDQLAAIRDTGGIVGLNFATGFLRKDGIKDPNTKYEIISHLELLMNALGDEKVALGSDFDGAIIPSFIGNCAGLPNLVQLMKDSGYPEELIKRICSKNWLDFLSKNF